MGTAVTVSGYSAAYLEDSYLAEAWTLEAEEGAWGTPPPLPPWLGEAPPPPTGEEGEAPPAGAEGLGAMVER